jgi:superfamily II DNA or RNA helicase
MSLHLPRINDSSPSEPLPIDRLSEDDIRDATSRSAFSNGERYWRQGRVLSVTTEQDGALIKARVRGSQRQPYVQTIAIEDEGEFLDIKGRCSCPIGFNCKHVAAALLAAKAGKLANPRSRREPNAAIVAALVRSLRDNGTAELFPDLKSSRAPVVAPPEVLASSLVSWIDSLARLEQTETEDYPADIHQRLVYVLETEQRAIGVPRLMVRPTSVRLLKDGQFSDKTSIFNAENASQPNAAKFLRPSDRAILKRLHAMRSVYGPLASGTALVGEDGVAALEAMIATGRCRWGSVDGIVVTQGRPRHGRLVWRLADDGSQYPDFALEESPEARVLQLAPPWYVEPAAAIMGPVETGFAGRIAAGVLAAPPVPASQGKLLRAAIARRLPALAMIEPPELEPPQQLVALPVPCLRLTTRDVRRPTVFGWNGAPVFWGEPQPVPIARLFFRYKSIEINATDVRDRPTFARDGRIVDVVRDRSAEQRAAARLSDSGFAEVSTLSPFGLPTTAERSRDFMLDDGEDGAGWVDVLYHELPALRADGWEIDTAADFPVHLVRADGDVAADIHEGTGIDWFELDLGVLVDGHRIDLVPVLLAAIAKPTFSIGALSQESDDDAPLYLPLGDGRTLALPMARLRPIITMLHELFTAGVVDAKAKRIGLSLREAASLTACEAANGQAGVVWRGGERLRELGRQLRETGSIPRAQLPSSFTATLRPYQARGVDWLQFLRVAGLGGVLADDMGLGKTVQALAYLAIEKASGRMDRPALVVAPTSVLANWQREAERFAPDLRVLLLHGLDRKTRFGDIAAHDLVLTTYPLLARDHATLQAQPWHAVVLDEAQTIKNPGAATTQLAFALEARHRIGLTGTPLENHLGEVWSLFAFLSPGFLGDRQSFKRQWRTPIEKHGDAGRRQLLARRIRPFLLRRTKTEVAAELPPKTEIVETIEMDGGQRDLYESIRLTMHARVRAAIAAKGLARSRITVLDALLKLRQICCDPRLLKVKNAPASRANSAKLDRLMEMVPQLIEEGRRVLLFSQFTSMLALIEEALPAAHVPYVLLTGDTRDRETPIKQFQSGKVPLFLISLKAGGLGLNLTAADTVIHYDPWWNPAVEDQATDRAHRLGQDKPVFVHKLVMRGSIEEKIEALKSRKRELAASLFNPDAASTLELTEADINDLFVAT